MAKKDEVEIGGYLADAQLTEHGTVVVVITGADFSERLFERLLTSKPTVNLVEFEGPRTAASV